MEDQALSNEGLARLLLERLEHISADSVLAHKASESELRCRLAGLLLGEEPAK